MQQNIDWSTAKPLQIPLSIHIWSHSWVSQNRKSAVIWIIYRPCVHILTQLVVLFHLFLQYICQRCNFIHMLVPPFGFTCLSLPLYLLLGLYSYFSTGNQIHMVGTVRRFKTELLNCRPASLLKSWCYSFYCLTEESHIRLTDTRTF